MQKVLITGATRVLGGQSVKPAMESFAEMIGDYKKECV